LAKRGDTGESFQPYLRKCHDYMQINENSYNIIDKST